MNPASESIRSWTLVFLAVILPVIHSVAAVQSLPFSDSFTNSEGNLFTVAPGVWDSAGNTGSEITVSNSAALTAPSGGAGKGVRWEPGGTARRAGVQFTPVTNTANNTLYVSFLVQVQIPPGTGSKLLAYLEASSSSTTSPQLGIFVDSTSHIGIGKKATSPVVLSPSGLNGSPHFVVVRYTFVSGGNDQADLWVDPAPTTFGAGTAPGSIGSTTGSSDPSSLSYFQISTPSGAGPLLFLDEVRIGTNWADVTPPSGPIITNSPIPVITQSWINADMFILRGTNGAANAPYGVRATTNLTLPLEQWTVIATNSFDANGNFISTNPVLPSIEQQFFLVQAGNLNLGPSAPAILKQPQSQYAIVGQTVLVNVVANGNPAPGYQWYFNTNTLLAGATNSTLTLTNVQLTDTGGYSVIVSNIQGSIPSAVATLTVTEAPTNGTFYVAPTGNDTNAGTLNAPFFTIAKAVSLAQPGNTIYVRGGSYFYVNTIRITNSGAALNPITLSAFPGEAPVLDFVNQPYADSSRGILITTNGNYWRIKGLEIARCGDNGIKLEGSHNVIEQCVFHHCGDTGLQIGFAHETDNPGDLGAYNEIINCDSYRNYDTATHGGNADGFACKLHPGLGNVFRGCRSWENSDDGWDLFESDHTIVISNCWTWHNGDKNLFPPSSSFGGNGNGFKLGGNGTGGSSKGTHLVMNCVAFNQTFPNTSRNGFTDNSHGDGEVLYNCVGFLNNYNFFFEQSVNSGKSNVFKNNVSFSVSGSTAGYSFGSGTVVQSNNSWNLPVIANASDFVTILESAAAAPRQADGSLPDGFARLVAGSDLIDQGVDVGLPFNTSAPDLGAYEFGGP